jgi:hypothetical protein
MCGMVFSFIPASFFPESLRPQAGPACPTREPENERRAGGEFKAEEIQPKYLCSTYKNQLQKPTTKTNYKNQLDWQLHPWVFPCLSSKKGRALLALFCYLDRQKVGVHFLPLPW